jgi:hypothetical protein
MTRLSLSSAPERIEAQEYVESEVVFQGGELVHAHIGAAGKDFSTKTPQADRFARDLLGPRL